MDDPKLQELRMNILNATSLEELSLCARLLQSRVNYLKHEISYRGTTQLIGQGHPMFEPPNILNQNGVHDLFKKHFC